MSDPTEIVVVGAGVLGLCVAVELGRRGHAVTLVDPGGANASSVAAGMIAPALEAAIEGADVARAALMRDAAGMWPELAGRLGVDLRPGPSEWRGADAEEMAARLRDLGFDVAVRNGSVQTSDFQIEPETAMARMCAMPGVTLVHDEVAAFERVDGGWRVRGHDLDVQTQTVVLAIGPAPPPTGLGPTTMAPIAYVVPIRGQIGWTGQALTARVVRGDRGYVAPMGRGAVIGASMGEGRRDTDVDQGEAEALLAGGAGLVDGTVDREAVDWRVGIRGATPDGLPMAGPSGEPGLHLALAPRRNGWLLGPLVGRVVADGIEGRAPAPHAAALDPLRFSPPGW